MSVVGVTGEEHYAAHRFGLVAGAGGKLVKRRHVALGNDAAQIVGNPRAAEVKEFATPGGEVIARKVSALGEVQCWLRADLAELARAALAREAADYARVTAELADFIRSTDRQGAARHGVSVEQYRADRHRKGAQWDNYRARQRAGRG